ncbi:MAG: hypothetical protein ACFCUO_06435 [Rhodospirillales bacterium]
MARLRDESRTGERLVALFLLGVLLFNPLVVRIFDRGAETAVFGVPLLYLYLFVGWALLIGLMASVIDRRDSTPAGGRDVRPPPARER